MPWRWLFIFVFFYSLAHGESALLNEDENQLARWISVITTTSPIPSMPSTHFIYEAQKSLHQVPGLAACKKIIVFDGLRDLQPDLIERYNLYKQNVQQLTEEDPYFENTQLLFCNEWVHLSGTIEQALHHVQTPYVFIHQHDLILLQPFDLQGVLASMQANPKIKYVHFGRRANTRRDFFHSPVDEVIEGPCFVPLCRSCGWSDQCHIASKEYYKQFVLPQCKRTFMEDVLQPALKQAIHRWGMAGREPFGTYLYGHLDDGPYIYHADGRHGLSD